LEHPVIPGRAETDEQKQETLRRLLEAWREKPAMRLGQLVYVATGGRDIFNDEDEKLQEADDDHPRPVQGRHREDRRMVTRLLDARRGAH
jgi:hypothetical protein